MDQFDRAQQIEAMQRDIALAEHQRRATAGAALTHCEDCGEPIPAERAARVPGVRRCIDCQRDHEHRHRLGAQ
ncbi:MAG: TraR/DksA C4-type zinc finger protein [Betaproteobacteria bacterium]|nr:TraR/DksA C4-type zinc finger protein [Betaproteobacteria bacterium]